MLQKKSNENVCERARKREIFLIIFNLLLFFCSVCQTPALGDDDDDDQLKIKSEMSFFLYGNLFASDLQSNACDLQN